LIIARSPLRISLGGGGTDLPSYYREHEGFLIAAAIDKYVLNTILEAGTGTYTTPAGGFTTAANINVIISNLCNILCHCWKKMN